MSSEPDLQTLADLVRHQGTARAQETALVFEECEISFGELDRRTNRVANALLALELSPGDRVATLYHDSDRMFDAVFGTAKARGVALGINWRLAPAEIRYILEDAGAKVLLVGAPLFEKVRAIEGELTTVEHVLVLRGEDGAWPSFDAACAAASEEDPGLEHDPEEVVVQQYTSGTTGHPKGVQLANRSFFAVVRAMRAVGDPWIGFGPDDVSLHTTPLFHIGGMWWACTAMRAGARNVVMDVFETSKALALTERHRVTKAFMVPAMIQMCLQDPACPTTDLSSFDCIVYGGSPIPIPTLTEGLRVFDCRFAQIYGLTETGNTAVCLRPEDHDDTESERLRAAGRPYPGVELKVIDDDGNALGPREVGEICIASPANMVGYWNLPEATAKTLVDGWIHTGDAGFLDEDGYVYVHDRVKDMIIYAGENIYPAEVESALQGHEAVAEVAVIGVPDERWGELVKAIVVLRPGKAAKPLELIRHCREEIAEFKVPKSVDFVDALPRTPSGKIQKAKLRKPYWEGRARQVN